MLSWAVKLSWSMYCIYCTFALSSHRKQSLSYPALPSSLIPYPSTPTLLPHTTHPTPTPAPPLPPPGTMLVFIFVFLTGVVLFGVVMFYLEQGQFEVTEAHPDGVYMRTTYDGKGTEVRCQSVGCSSWGVVGWNRSRQIVMAIVLLEALPIYLPS